MSGVGQIEKARRVARMADVDHSVVCYWRDECGWWIYLPGCGAGVLQKHHVEEHSEDGSISVSPSIRMRGHDNGTPTERHGFLERGEWREV